MAGSRGPLVTYTQIMAMVSGVGCIMISAPGGLQHDQRALRQTGNPPPHSPGAHTGDNTTPKRIFLGFIPCPLPPPRPGLVSRHHPYQI